MSERDLVKARPADELRLIKDRVKAIRETDEVSAAAASLAAAGSTFTLEAFRSGVFVDTFSCRMTIGTLALLRGVSSRCIGYGKNTGPLTDYDIALAVFVMSDENRGLAVSHCDDEDELKAAVKKIRRRLNINRAAVDLMELLRRVDIAMNPGAPPADDNPEEEDKDALEVAELDNVWRAPDDAWADDVDLLAHEYGWRDDYILWEVPLCRVIRLKESLRARRSGKPRTTRTGRSTGRLLAAIEKADKDIVEGKK